MRVIAIAWPLSTTPGALTIWDAAVLALLVALGVTYATGATVLARRGGHQRRREPIAFAAGWLALLASVLPPIDSLAIELFSIHMIQHELMILVGAPLVIAARPLPTCLWAFRRPTRAALARVLQGRAAMSAWQGLTTPVVAWGLHGLAVWIWHVPALYDAAVGNEAVHAIEHAMFVGTAALFWWGLLYGRYGRAGYGAAVFYVFTTTVHTGLLGAILTFARAPLYPVYIRTTAARGVDVLADQQLAGLLMWIPAGLVLTAAGIALFAAWLGESERRTKTSGLC